MKPGAKRKAVMCGKCFSQSFKRVRLCVGCMKEFMPNSAVHKWCDTCKGNRVNLKRDQHAFRTKSVGRVCRYCKWDDRFLRFFTNTLCSRCNTRIHRFGLCQDCKKQPAYTGGFCRTCKPQTWTKPKVITLYCRNRTRQITVSAYLRIGNRTASLKATEVCVKPRDFAVGTVVNAIAIKGFDPWPSRDDFLKLYELVRAVKAGDLDVTYHLEGTDPWRSLPEETRFRVFKAWCAQQGMQDRTMERFKRKLRDWNLWPTLAGAERVLAIGEALWSPMEEVGE